MKADLRLIPALVTAWLGSAAALNLAGQIGWGGLVAVGCALFAGAALAAVIALRKRQERGWRAQVIVCLGVAAAVFMSSAIRLAERDTVGELLAGGGSAVVHGTVAGPPKPAGPEKSWEATADLHAIAIESGGRTVAARVSLVVLGDVLDVRRGETVSISGRLAPLPPSSDAAGFLLEGAVLGRAPPSGPFSGIATARDAFLDVTDGLSAQGRALVPGIAVGDDSRIDATLEAAMRRTSLAHLTAVSGSHVSLVMAGLAVLLGRFARRARVAGAIAGLGALVALVGPEPSVVRAAAMASVAILALARGRPPQAVPSLAAGVTAVLVIDPWLSLQFGFALSAAATASILVLTMPLTEAIAGASATGRRRALGMALAVPIAAGLACAPIMVLFSPEFSLIGVAANAVVAPVVAPATVFSLLGVGLAVPLPGLALVFARIAEVFTGWIAGVAVIAGHVPFAAVPWPGGPGGAALLAVLGAAIIWGILLLGRLRRRRTSGGVAGVSAGVSSAVPAGVLVVAMVIVLGITRLASLTPDWFAWQCDVGQGSAMLVRSGPGRAVMIDVGPEDGRSQDCLARAGVSRLDLLVLTHPHADHVGNLPAVLAAVPVERLLVSAADRPAGTVAWVRREAAAVGLEPEVAAAGESGTAGTLEWTAMWPRPGATSGDVNDLSLIVLFQAPSGHTAMQLGDIGRDAQNALDSTMEDAGAGHVDVVAVAHHGAKQQSRDLAERLQPDVALVSVGFDNEYGHPAAEAIELYESVSGSVRRTDDWGDVVVDVGGSWDAEDHGDHVGQSLARAPRSGEGPRGSAGRPGDRTAAAAGARCGPGGRDHADRCRQLRDRLAHLPREPVPVR
ncbi:MAG TPA: ComEC/Rec2 family competence protein [Actinomycetaceae bacterium]|nr:ComEC/Rec2 family competence protein [Actinomycetaceae bacterium]